MTSHNADDLAALKQAMARATPAPDQARKADVMARSQQVFDTRQDARHRATPTAPRTMVQRVFDKVRTRTAGAMAAATALAAAGILILGPQGQQVVQGPAGLTLPQQDTLGDAPAAMAALPEPAPLPEPEPATTTPSPRALEPETGSPQLFAADTFDAPAPPAPLDAPAPADAAAMGRIAASGAQFAAGAQAALPMGSGDTASYARLRAALNRGQRPAPDTIREGEMINHFTYDIPAPTPQDIGPFRPTVQIFTTPWNPDTQVLLIGIRGAMSGGATLPIADDLHIEVTFTTGTLAQHRIVGEPPRAFAPQAQGRDGTGPVEAGFSVVALYEITPTGPPPFTGDIGTLSLHWTDPLTRARDGLDYPIAYTGTAPETVPDTDALFATAIAGFGQLLRGSDDLGQWSYDEAIALANANIGADEVGDRREAVHLMRRAQSLAGP